MPTVVLEIDFRYESGGSATAAASSTGAEMSRLFRVVEGAWQTAVVYALSPMMPEGGTATGEEEPEV